ncbi:MAG TPA: aminoacetone oxidase family FAD-binding enzyme [Ruminococcaceae bacterium]|nr:aminoacetone oxidase family FAD-binding enzyme [Oscillospiraceae bacterium]
MTQTFDVIVAGGGAAGMMAAGTAAQNGLRTLLLEKNERPGRKLMITGKGRCNVTNNCPAQTVIDSAPTNGRFLYSAVSRFPPSRVMEFFEALGVPLKTERGGRVFPRSDRAADVVDALARFLRENGVLTVHGTVSGLLLAENAVSGAVLEDGRKFFAPHVIVACGGASYPGTGSTGDGYRLARRAGHTVTPLRPSLVPLVGGDGDCAQMQGLALKNIAVKVFDRVKSKAVYEDFGEMLFTHFGLSGPVILSASSHMREMSPGRYRVLIDLKPALSPERLDARLQRDFEKYQNRNFINSLHDLLPAKMIPVMVSKSGIPPETKCNSIEREQRLAFAALLKEYPVEVRSFRPIEEAIVTSGGVSVREVDPKTMASKLVRGLSFAGEVLDVDAYTGGFNLQIAFSTGRLAANSIEGETI